MVGPTQISKDFVMPTVSPLSRTKNHHDYFALPEEQVGLSYKPDYFEEAISTAHGLGWFEIHAENYMVEGGPLRNQMERLRQNYPVSCHGVGLSIGSSEPLSHAHLARLKKLVDWLEPAVFSEHLAWSSHGGLFFNDLLPLPYTKDTLQNVVNHIDEVQQMLHRPLLLENPSTYVTLANHEMSESDFICEAVKQTGCQLLLDVNNLFVSSANQRFCADEFLKCLPAHAVTQIHVAGHSIDQDDNGDVLLIDSHSTAVSNEVWALYRSAIEQFGPVPTLLEWDDDVPDFATLRAEAMKAKRFMNDKSNREPHRVAI